jgi:CubicO group peptidase (beta-lactamase class C family)
MSGLLPQDVPASLPSSDPARIGGSWVPGFEPVVEQFIRQVQSGAEVGASLAIHHRGRCVVDIWGGWADRRRTRPWVADSRVLLFSVTKAFTAMAFHLLAEDGLLDWDAPVARWWPEFAAAGKQDITVRTLLNHRAGLAGLTPKFTLAQCLDPTFASPIARALADEAPAWTPGEGQGYHAITYGMYAGELFRRLADEPLSAFLERRVFAPLGSDVRLGAEPELDARCAELLPFPNGRRVLRMAVARVLQPRSTEARVLDALRRPGSLVKRAFENPSVGLAGPGAYDTPAVRQACLPWASATGSARGVARAMTPWSLDGSWGGYRLVQPTVVEGLRARQGWSEQDAVLCKPLGWSQGFMKEERHLFSPNPGSFGHSGMGGALGWADPDQQVAIGYAMNRMDWRVRSPRCLALCHALYECRPLC